MFDTSGHPAAAPTPATSGPFPVPTTTPPTARADPQGGGPSIPRPQTTQRRSLIACCLLSGTGLILIVTGSFLPWVTSGSVRRSSYAIVGIVDRLGFADDGPLAVLITGWPFVGALCVVPVIAGILRWWRTAGVLGVIYGLVTGALSFGLLLVGAGRGGLGIRIEPIGPAVMAAGAVLLLCGGTALALGSGSPIRHRNTRLTAT